jgi:outer membrane protein TolC
MFDLRRISVPTALACLAACASVPPEPIHPQDDLEAFNARQRSLAQVAPTESVLDLRPVSIDLADGLSLEEACWVALVFNPDLRVARAEAGVTQARADHAGLWPDPSIGLQFSRLIDAVDNPNELFGLLWFTIPVSGRLEAEVALRGEERRAALADVAALEWTTICDLRAAWARWSMTRQSLDSFAGQQHLLEQSESAAAALAELGEAGPAEGEIRRAKVAVARADLAQELIREEQQAADVQRLLGLPRIEGSGLVSTLGAPSQTSSCEDASDFERRLMNGSPSIRRALVRYAVAESRLVLELRKQYPDLQVGPGFGQQDGFEQFQLGLNIPIPILNANRGGIAEAVALRGVARAEVEHAVTIAAIEASQACRRLNASRDIRRELERSVLPALEQQDRLILELVALGELDRIEAADRLVDAREARHRWLQAQLEESLATIDLARVLGPVAERVTAEESTP